SNRYVFLNKSKISSFLHNQDYFSSYLYRLKNYLTFYKYLIYNRYFKTNSTLSYYLNTILIFKYFNNNNNNFIINLLKNKSDIYYNFSYIRDEKLKLKYLYNINRYRIFITKVNKLFNNYKKDYSRLLINFLSTRLQNILYYSKFAFSLHSSEQL